MRHSGHFSIDSENSTPEQGKTTALVVQKARDLVGQFDQRFRIIRHHRLVAEFSQERCVEFAKHDDVLHNIAGRVYQAHTVARECYFEGERMVKDWHRAAAQEWFGQSDGPFVDCMKEGLAEVIARHEASAVTPDVIEAILHATNDYPKEVRDCIRPTIDALRKLRDASPAGTE